MWLGYSSCRHLSARLAKRAAAAAWWGARRLWIWGGTDKGGELDNGSSYDFAQKAWKPMPKSDLSARASATAVWTGTEAIVFGGFSGFYVMRDGKIFRP